MSKKSFTSAAQFKTAQIEQSEKKNPEMLQLQADLYELLRKSRGFRFNVKGKEVRDVINKLKSYDDQALKMAATSLENALDKKSLRAVIDTAKQSLDLVVLPKYALSSSEDANVTAAFNPSQSEAGNRGEDLAKDYITYNGLQNKQPEVKVILEHFPLLITSVYARMDKTQIDRIDNANILGRDKAPKDMVREILSVDNSDLVDDKGQLNVSSSEYKELAKVEKNVARDLLNMGVTTNSKTVKILGTIIAQNNIRLEQFSNDNFEKTAENFLRDKDISNFNSRRDLAIKVSQDVGASQTIGDSISVISADNIYKADFRNQKSKLEEKNNQIRQKIAKLESIIGAKDSPSAFKEALDLIAKGQKEIKKSQSDLSEEVKGEVDVLKKGAKRRFFRWGNSDMAVNAKNAIIDKLGQDNNQDFKELIDKVNNISTKRKSDISTMSKLLEEELISLQSQVKEISEPLSPSSRESSSLEYKNSEIKSEDVSKVKEEDYSKDKFDPYEEEIEEDISVSDEEVNEKYYQADKVENLPEKLKLEAAKSKKTGFLLKFEELSKDMVSINSAVNEGGLKQEELDNFADILDRIVKDGMDVSDVDNDVAEEKSIGQLKEYDQDGLFEYVVSSKDGILDFIKESNLNSNKILKSYENFENGLNGKNISADVRSEEDKRANIPGIANDDLSDKRQESQDKMQQHEEKERKSI